MEPTPNESREAASEPSALERATAERVDSMEQHARERIAGMDARERARKIPLLRRLARTARRVMVAGALLIGTDAARAVNANRNLGQVTESPDENGQRSYRHEDGETTDILNFLSGSPELKSEDLLRRALRRTVWDYLASYGQLTGVVYGQIEMLSDDELRTRLLRGLDDIYAMMTGPGAEDPISPGIILELKARVADDSGDWRRRFLERKGQGSRRLYDALWRVERMAGAPRIRAIEQSTIPKMARRIATGSERHAYYDGATNTMYIELTIGDFTAEAAHGVQFAGDPLGEYFHTLRGHARTAVRMVTGLKSIDEAYGELYEIPGTFENEAHDIIESALRKQLFETPANPTEHKEHS